MMVVVTASIGYFLGANESGVSLGASYYILAMLGTGLAGCGASVLNQYIERDVDAKMKRTENRPIPAGVVTPASALYLGVAMVMGGIMLLLINANLWTAFLTLQSAFLYVLVYTPMKRLTWWNTSVGAIPGAMPMLIGWAAATNSVSSPGPWILFAVLYIWQHPHFFAIAWMYRDDYARGNLKMLPVVKPDGKSMFLQVILFSVVMLPVSLLPSIIGMSGWLYFSGALILGIVFLAYSMVFNKERDERSARALMRVSLIYLPLLLIVIALDAAMV
jgi:protoheme IX farnesyltransferase